MVPGLLYTTEKMRAAWMKTVSGDDGVQAWKLTIYGTQVKKCVDGCNG